jgi:MFS family permease
LVDESQAGDDRVWGAERRALSLGLLLTITMVAFENLGVATAMPVVAADLHGVGLVGFTVTATLLGSVIGISAAGARVDRHGPAAPFVAGLALFGLGVLGCGLAPTMPFLVACRFVQGLGVGAVPAVIYASIGRAFSERARARMFALLSTAWVVPGLVGPGISGAVAQHIGWRWVFLGVLPLVAINGALTLPPLAQLGPPEHSDHTAEVNPIRLAVLLAAAAGTIVVALNAATLATAPLVVLGIVAAAYPLHRLMPPGTFRARAGVPAAIATRGAQTFGFFGVQAFLPLALVELRNQSPTMSGVVLTASTVSWTAGAWLQERRGHVWGRRTMVRRGLVLLVVGGLGACTVVVAQVPVVVVAIAWTVASLGMGMSYGGLSLLVLADVPKGQEGRATSALQLAEMLSIAIGTGIGGAAVAAADRAHDLRPGITVALGLAVASALVSTATSRRLHEPTPAVL